MYERWSLNETSIAFPSAWYHTYKSIKRAVHILVFKSERAFKDGLFWAVKCV
jgi:hypothetical protein